MLHTHRHDDALITNCLPLGCEHLPTKYYTTRHIFIVPQVNTEYVDWTAQSQKPNLDW